MKKVFGALLAGLMFVTGIGAAIAQDSGAAVVMIESSGVLSAQIEDVDFGTIQYSYDDQAVSANVVITVVDGSGTGSGWKVNLFGTDFVRDPETSFSSSALVLGNGTITSNAGAGTEGISATGLTLGANPGGPIATAASGNGMGDYTIAYPSTLTVPGGTLTGEYRSTLTVNIPSAP